MLLLLAYILPRVCGGLLLLLHDRRGERCGGPHGRTLLCWALLRRARYLLLLLWVSVQLLLRRHLLLHVGCRRMPWRILLLLLLLLLLLCMSLPAGPLGSLARRIPGHTSPEETTAPDTAIIANSRRSPLLLLLLLWWWLDVVVAPSLQMDRDCAISPKGAPDAPAATATRSVVRIHIASNTFRQHTTWQWREVSRLTAKRVRGNAAVARGCC
jgi:hypothetical protein